MKRILLCGAMGKMGRQVAALAVENDFEIAAGVDQAGSGNPAFPLYQGFDDGIKETADVLIDFSRPSALEGLLRYAVSAHLPCVLCSTGYAEKENAMIREASASIPLFVSANMSQGVYALKKLIAELKKENPYIEANIFNSMENVDLDAVIGYKKDGVKHSFLDEY